MKKRLILSIALIFAACSSLPYKDDTGFLVSAQAGSAEFPISINGKLCSDMDGEVGLCAKRVSSTEDITFSFMAQPYGWNLVTTCSTGVTQPLPATVEPGKAYSFTMKSSDFSRFRSFSCMGEIKPQDRGEPVSALFEVRFSVYHSKYVQRESIFITDDNGKKFLVLGKYARSALVFDDGAWKRHKKKTIVEIKGDPSKVKAYSESFAMRYNYLGMVE